MTYYNEFDPKAAAWLRELISAGLIPAGHVDTRSIVDVQPSDLAGFAQCHFFAGIGGWAYALRLAGWFDDEPVWTGSCPCQPFSAAGKQRGTEDERHLWPELARLVAKCSPSTVFGEQVASKLGREWLAGVRVDLEGMGYAVGAADLCAAGVGAPHIRQRLYWVGDANCAGSQQGRQTATTDRHGGSAKSDGDVSGIGDAARGRCGKLRDETCKGSCGHSVGSGWERFDVVNCRDGKARRVEPGSFPLAHGVSGRVGLLRGYSNAIVPQVAAEFIRAFCEARNEVTPGLALS